jgi:hypothetical protein
VDPKTALRPIVVIVAIVAFVFVGCDNPSGGSGAGAPAIETVPWEPDADGFLRFSTNDPEHLGYFFAYPLPFAFTSDYRFEVTLEKSSGGLAPPMGVVFNYTDIDNFYSALIRPNGGWLIHKRSNGVWAEEFLASCNEDCGVNSGLNERNVISVEYADADQEWTLTINGNVVTTFTDPDQLDPGYVGLKTVIGGEEQESFPDVPVDVRFRVEDAVAPAQQATVEIGTADAWSALSPVITDPAGNAEIISGGSDISEVWFAYDDTWAYWRMDFHDGPPTERWRYIVWFCDPASVNVSRRATGNLDTRVVLYDNAGGLIWRADDVNEWERLDDITIQIDDSQGYLEMKFPVNVIGNDPVAVQGYVMRGPDDEISPGETAWTLLSLD